MRFCGLCRKNVYNLSAMPREAAERLVAEREGDLCALLYRRQDGTVLTADCPVGRRRFAVRLVKRVAAGIAVVGMSFFGRYFTAVPKEPAKAKAESPWPANAPMSRKQAEELLGSLGYVR